MLFGSARSLLAIASLGACHRTAGHGLLTFPPSTRHGGSLKTGGSCTRGECMWFSNQVEVHSQPTLPQYARTIEVNISGGPEDIYRTAPWRAPGFSPVFGSGCGAAGGGPAHYMGGGDPPPGVGQGLDGLALPKVGSQYWQRGSTAEVAWAITANHGGGYSYRLCPNGNGTGTVTEECFQRNVLRFAGNTSWIVYPDGSHKEFERTTVQVSTSAGTQGEWARNPIPGCRMCPTYRTCGARVEPGAPPGTDSWNQWSICSARCDGSWVSQEPSCPPGTTQFPEAVPGLSSFENKTWAWSIMDRVQVPMELDPGEYILSWRWDCEETWQVWQNCADITIGDGEALVPLQSQLGSLASGLEADLDWFV